MLTLDQMHKPNENIFRIIKKQVCCGILKTIKMVTLNREYHNP